MSSVPVEALQGGLCYDLDPAVLDKYFMSDKRGGFENLTAKAICAHCPILQACLEQAIADPPAHGIRGGETSESIAALRYRHYRERTPIPVLARMAIRHQTPLEGRPYGRRRLLAGQFQSPGLAYPDLAGEPTPTQARSDTTSSA